MIATTSDLGALINEQLAPGMLYVPTPDFNFIQVCEKTSMQANNGGVQIFMRPRNLKPPTVQLGNSGIDPVAQVPQRDIIKAQQAFYGTGK